MNDNDQKALARLCEKGDEHAEAGNYMAAIVSYSKALKLVPEPYYEYEASTWVLVAIGDAYYLAADFENALDYFRRSLLCPDALENPFIHLRMGQSYYELGNLDEGADELARAYMLEGLAIFDQTDPKYLDYLKTKIHINDPVKKSWWKFW